MKILAQKPDLEISWTVSSPLVVPRESREFDVTKYFPSYNIYVYNHDNDLIDQIFNLDNRKTKELFSFENSPFQPAEGRLGDVDGGIKIIADLEKNKYRKKIIENYFGYSFEKNCALYFKKYNSNGFYNNLKFKIEFNSDIPSYLEFEVEYPSITLENVSSIFYKIYRSNDLYSCKLLIDYNLFNQCEADSIIVFPKAYFNSKTIELNKIFIENINNIWLNSNEDSKLLTIPFTESEMVDEYKNIDLEIYVLNKVQSNIIKYFINKLSQNDLRNLLNQRYINQSFSYSLVDKSEAFFQGKLYLFNELSFENISLPQINVNGITYTKFFPISNKNNLNTIICTRNNLTEGDVTVSIQDVDLGYYYNNNFCNIEQDILYFSHNNILKIDILEVRRSVDSIKTYIEVITNFKSIDNIFFNSNELKLEDKYTKVLDNQLYSTFLLSYEYNNQEMTVYSEANNIDLSNLLYKEVPINFSFKIV